MHSPEQQSFLQAVLGDAGCRALVKAGERSKELGNVLLPRTILAWLGAQNEYRGEIPGLQASELKLQKSSNGYVGEMSSNGYTHNFQDATIFHVTAALMVGLGVEPDVNVVGVRDMSLDRLGRSIDTLVKAHKLHAELSKKEPKPADGAPAPHAEPLEPKPPEPPTKVQPEIPQPKPEIKKPKLPKIKRPAQPKTLRLTRSEAAVACDVCGQAQFTQDEFTGCMCFAALAKTANVISFGADEVVLELPEEWDREATVTLLEIVGRR